MCSSDLPFRRFLFCIHEFSQAKVQINKHGAKILRKHLMFFTQNDSNCTDKNKKHLRTVWEKQFFIDFVELRFFIFIRNFKEVTLHLDIKKY